MTAVAPRFSYQAETTRVVFGPGSVQQLPAEIRVQTTRIVLISTPGRSELVHLVSGLLGSSVVGVFDRAAMHVPVAVLREALDVVHRHSADCIIALGGGSAIGVGKAVVHEAHIPLVAVPTTYSGSEMTAIWGTTDGDTKRTARDPSVAPGLVIYDPELTLSLSSAVSAASGMNAVAHCVEALYAPEAATTSNMLAAEGLAMLAHALPRVVRQPDDLLARSDALFGAHFAGYALNLTTMGLHHRLAHVLGGLGLPHAETHAVLLPHVVAFNADAAPEAMKHVAEGLGAPDAVAGIHDLATALGISRGLAALGLTREMIPKAAEMALKTAVVNPRRVTQADIAAILLSAI